MPLYTILFEHEETETKRNYGFVKADNEAEAIEVIVTREIIPGNARFSELFREQLKAEPIDVKENAFYDIELIQTIDNYSEFSGYQEINSCGFQLDPPRRRKPVVIERGPDINKGKEHDKGEKNNYDAELEEYLLNGINYNANTIRAANKGDLEQLAADSFHAGFLLGIKSKQDEQKES